MVHSNTFNGVNCSFAGNKMCLKIKKVICCVLVGLLLSLEIFGIENSDEQEKMISERVQLAMNSPDYMVTAGDVYLLSYAAGATYVKYMIPVDTTYKIKVANLAVISGEGKTFFTIKKRSRTHC